MPDAVLRLLYQSTDLFVFPSLYEGYGLPIAEALACGARTIGSSTSAVAELLVPEAQFDPGRRRRDRGRDRARAHRRRDRARALDEQARPSVARTGTRSPTAWPSVYERLLARPRPAGAPAPAGRGRDAAPAGRERRRRLQLPAARRAARALRRACVRRRAALRRSRRSGRRVRPTASRCSRCGASSSTNGRAAATTASSTASGNSQFHAGALAQLRRRSGVVLAHEVRLTDLYALSADEPGAVPGGFAACLDGDVRRACRPGPGSTGRLAPDEAERLGVLMAAEIVALADRFVVMSEFAADRVRLDVAARGRRSHLRACRSACPNRSRTRRRPRTRGPLIASFGVVNDDQAVLAARRRASGRARRGARTRSWRSSVRAPTPTATSSSRWPTRSACRERVTVTGAVTTAEYAAWLDRAAVAVQLRRTANGESSARGRRLPRARARCSSSPASAPGRDLPDDGVDRGRARRVGRRARDGRSPTCSTIPAAGRELRGRGPRLRRASTASRSSAERLFDDVIEPATRIGLSVRRLSDALASRSDAGVEGAAARGAAVFGGAALHAFHHVGRVGDVVPAVVGAPARGRSVTAGSSTRSSGAPPSSTRRRRPRSLVTRRWSAAVHRKRPLRPPTERGITSVSGTTIVTERTARSARPQLRQSTRRSIARPASVRDAQRRAALDLHDDRVVARGRATT